MAEPENGRFVSIPKLAKDLGVHEQTVHRWRKAGKVQASRNDLVRQ